MMTARAKNAATTRTTIHHDSSPPTFFMMLGTASPTSTKIKVLAQKPICSQVSVRACQLPGDMMVRP